MSTNFEYDDGIHMSIDFFNSLTDEEKTLIVTDLNPNTFKIPQYYDALAHLLSHIQNDMTKYDSITIGNQLMDMGVEETWARLLVTNMKKHAPTLSYQISQINRMDDQKFAEIFGKIMDQLWREKTATNDVADKFGIDKEQLNCMIDVMTQCTYDLMRGDNSATKICSTLLKNGLTPAKVDTMIKSIHLQEKDWYRWLLFRNVQDSVSNTQEIKEQNARILSILSEILTVLRDQRPERRTRQTPGLMSTHER